VLIGVHRDIDEGGGATVTGLDELYTGDEQV
jgi:hypothetical protein